MGLEWDVEVGDMHGQGYKHVITMISIFGVYLIVVHTVPRCWP